MNHHRVKPVILVVDDDVALRLLIVRMLNRGGFTTLTAGDVANGLSLVRRCRGGLDLAIVDMVMPGMSGLDLATDLDREYPNLKILYTSGYVDSVAADVLSRLTPDCVLLKPFSEQALLERVHMLLEMALRREPGKASGQAVSAIRGGTLG